MYEGIIASLFHKFGDLSKRICKAYYDSLHSLCLNVKTIDKEFAIQLADNSKDVALKSRSHFVLKHFAFAFK